MKCKKKYENGGEVPSDDKKKKKKVRSRGEKSSDASADFNSQLRRKGTRGSCEEGNLRACKSDVSKTKKFNPSKSVISKRRLVKSKPQEEKKPTPNSTGKFSNPRFL